MLSRPILAVAGLALAAGPALAQPEQEQEGRPPPAEWRIAVGAGAVAGPEFPGADDYEIMPVPYVDIQYKDRFFLNFSRGLGAFLLNRDGDGGLGYVLGAAVGPGFQDREREDAPNLPEVDMTALAQVFGEISLGRFAIEAAVAQDILFSGHDGFYAEVGADYQARIGRSGFVSLGPHARFAGGDYMDSFYTVTPRTAQRAGLPAFDADGGLERVGGRLLASWRLARQWELFTLASYDRLVSDAADSPIVREEDQFGVVVAVAYRF